MRDRTYVLPCAGFAVAVILAVACAADAAQATNDCTIYVRAGFVPVEGPADGLTPETAFASITLGARAVRGGGDVVCVGPGLYVDGDINPVRDGAPGVPGQSDFPVVIRGDATGVSTDDPAGPVQLVPPDDRPESQTPSTAFLLIGRHDVVIDGFEISGYADAGIQARAADGAANSGDLVIRNNAIRGCRTGIDLHAEGTIVVDHNTVEGSSSSGISVESCTEPSPFSACRGLPGGVVVPTISNNTSHDNGAHGLFMRIGDEAMVQNNTFFNNGFTGVALRGVSDSVVANNMIYENGEEGVSITGAFAEAAISAQSADVTARNATVKDNTISGCRIGIDVHAEGMIVVEHNTTVGGRSSGISVESCSGLSTTGVCVALPAQRVTPLISNNRSGGNGAHGIFLRIGDDAVVQNNVLFSNGSSGVTLRGVADALVANNLIYRNGQQGVSIGTGFVDPATSGDPTQFASPNAVVLNNTLYGNAQWGVEVGSSLAASPGSAVVNNIIWHNGDGLLGIGVLNERGGVANIREPSVCSYVSGFNDVLDGYGPDTPRNNYDLRVDPSFVGVAGPDGVLGGQVVEGKFVDRSSDDDFHLHSDSPAVNAGSTEFARLGLTGSTSTLGSGDQGIVDLGYHYGATADQMLFYESPYMPLFVRQSGDDTGDGLSPATAFASIGTAARRARAGVTVVVGPGVYKECDIHSPPDSGRAVFLADPSGAQTGDAPGVVLVDAGKCFFDEVGQTYRPGPTGFNLSRVCGVVIDGFHISGGSDDGVELQNQCDRSVVRNNVVFTNAKRGINITNSDDVRLANNLAYGNGGGIQIGSGAAAADECADAGSRRATVEFNTAYNNTYDGIFVGAGACPSTGATVRYNVTGANSTGIEVGSDETRDPNLVGYTSGYNLIADRLGTGIARGIGDLIINLATEALYLDPTAIALDGDWRADMHFRLAQLAAGQAQQSRAVDFSDITAVKAGLSTRSTRSDGDADSGTADRGYHYPGGGPPLAGDCDGDGSTAINELVRSVNIALGNAPLSACTAIDVDGNGAVSIAELIQAVRAALGD